MRQGVDARRALCSVELKLCWVVWVVGKLYSLRAVCVRQCDSPGGWCAMRTAIVMCGTAVFLSINVACCEPSLDRARTNGVCVARE